MDSRISRSLWRILTVLALVSCATLWVAAQDDPDPNSPTPVLMNSTKNPVRILAVTGNNYGRVDATRLADRAYPLNSNIVVFVTNISLMDGEGANAFRVLALDEKGHYYTFPVVDIEKSSNMKSAYALTIALTDELGYWDPPPAGDVLIQVTWRGLGSNQLLLGLGRMGGGVKAPTQTQAPAPQTVTASPIVEAPIQTGKISVQRPTLTGRATPQKVNTPDYVGYKWVGDRMRFEEEAAFGPTPLLDSTIRRIGLRAWLNTQFDAPYPTFPYPTDPLKPDNVQLDCDGQNGDDATPTCFRDTYSMYKPQAWFFQEALYGNNQLRHRVAWALAQIMVTSGVDIQQGRQMVEYHKILSNNAFGNFRTLMGQMTLNPTMGDYLSMDQSTKNNPNENYAREIMQLFTVGLFMLNQDGTLQLDGSGNPIPTYDQNNVSNLTKVFTGWNVCSSATPGVCPNIASGVRDFIDPMLLNNNVTTLNGNLHDLTAKTLLSYPGSTTTNVPACPVLPAANACNASPAVTAGLPNTLAYANASMNQALDNIFYHPNVAPFISKTLIQHLVTSSPTPAYVGRVAAVFNDNGFGVRGDLKAVVKAILLDVEARGDVKSDPTYGKLREPVQLTTNLLRTFNVLAANLSPGSQSDGVFVSSIFANTRVPEFTGMAQVPFMSPTVFNFYSPGYIIPGTATPGPEFALMTTSTSISRANFVNRMVYSNIPVSTPGNPDVPNGTALDFSDLTPLSVGDTSGNTLMDAINQRMMHGTMSASMRSTILNAVTAIAVGDGGGITRVRAAVFLTATSSQYQVQR